MMKKTVWIFCIICANMLFAGTDPYAKVLEDGLKEASLIPKVMSCYVMIEMKNIYHNPESEMDSVMSELHSIEKRIGDSAPDDRIKAVALESGEKWEALEGLLKKPVNKEGFMELKSILKPIREARRGMIRYAKSKSTYPYIEELYLAGKLAAISRKFSSLYMLTHWGENLDRLNSEMEEQKKMFISTMEKLSSFGNIGEKEKKYIELMRKNLNFFNFVDKKAKSFLPALIYKKSEEMSRYAYAIMDSMIKKGGGL